MNARPCVEGSWVEPVSRRTFGYRLWQAQEARALLVIVHGFGEHGGRYELFARELAEQGIAVAAPDLWAHGRSGGTRGDLGEVADCVRQLQMMAAEVFLPQAGQERYTVFGHSFGGLASILWALDAPAPLRRVVIQAPLLEMGFPISPWKQAAAVLLARVWPTWSFHMGLDLSMLSHDPAVQQAYLADPLTHHAMSVRTYWSLQRAKDEAFERAPALRVPVLLLCGTGDRIISVARAQQWFERVGCLKRRVMFPGGYHELHHEAARDEVLRAVRDWTLTND